MQNYYSEKLICGGELKIYEQGWTIEYYFQGPDLRYSGQYFRIRGEEIDQYIAALNENFLEYKKLKQQNVKHKTFSTPAKMNMTIRIAPYSEGVCLFGHNKAIANQKQLDKLIASYEYAKQKVLEVAKNNY